MSNYHPPQYGTHNNTNNYMTPSAATYNIGPSQYSYQNYAQPQYHYIQTQPNGVSQAPQENAYSFNVNGQGLTAPGVGTNRGLPNYNTQSHPLPHPQPPFPPGPTSSESSHFPQNPMPASTKLPVPSPHTYLPSKSQTFQFPALDQDTSDAGIGISKDVISTASDSDLEDGEVGDEESDKHIEPAEASEMGVNLSRRSGQKEDRNNELNSELSPQPHSNVKNAVSSGRTNDSLLESDTQPSTSTQFQQPTKLNGDADLPNGSTSARAIDKTSDLTLPSYGIAKVKGSTRSEFMAEKQGQARQALIDLRSHGHDFNTIVSHGMDPNVLKTLYNEVGIPMDSSPSSQLQRELEVNARATSVPNLTNKDDHDQSRKAEPGATSRHKKVSSPIKSPLNTVKAKEKEPVASSALPKTAPMHTPTARPSGGFKPTDTKPLDRKEYIARMLAAKAAKPAASTTSSEQPKMPEIAVSEPSSQAPISSPAMGTSSLPATAPGAQGAEQLQQDDSSIRLPNVYKDNQNIDLKRKAQTELARQKIEALKSQRETARATNSLDSANETRGPLPTDSPGPSSVANTSIAPPEFEGVKTVNEAEAKAAENEAVIAATAEGRRLYIGNLAYATTEGELRAFFSGYSVESTTIPVSPRTIRPVGYAFVDLSTAEEAQKAINELAGKVMLERKVSVQLARKPETAHKPETAAEKQAAEKQAVEKQTAERQAAAASGASINVPQPPPPPSRQGSYAFASQRASFSLPGLFMAPVPSDPIKSPESRTSQSFATLPHRQQETAYQPIAPQYMNSFTTEASQNREVSADVMKENVPIATVTPALTHRKRQRAADFLDSPPTRVKRPLGQQEDSTVIIDVSDEDMTDYSDHEGMDVDFPDARSVVANSMQHNENRFSQRKLIENMPPLSDFPPRKKPPLTAPSLPPQSQAKDSKGLRSKEMEIELMNRKIAELEQRVNAKRSTSRAVTPKESINATISPAPQRTSPAGEGASETTQVPETSSDSIVDARNRQSSLPTADDIDTAEAELKLQEVERAKASVERSLAADAAQASHEHQMLHAGTTENAQDQVEPTSPEEPQQVSGSERIRLQQVEPQSLHIEEHGPDQHESSGRFHDDDSHSQLQEESQLRETKKARPQKGRQVSLLEEQRQMRKRALESGLLVLDATIEKTKQKLESMRKEVMDLEIEVQKGVEGREALVRELESLSQTVEQPMDGEESQAAKGEPSPATRLESTEEAESKASNPVEDQDHSVDLKQEDAVVPPTQPYITTDEPLFEGELEEDVMDISRSEVDEGELSEYSPTIANAETLQIENTVNDEQSDKLSTDDGIKRRPSMPDRTSANREGVEIEMSNAKVETFSTDGRELEEPLHVTEHNHSTDVQDEEQMSHPSMANDSDADDYEPPEPALALKASAVENESSSIPLSSIEVNGKIAPSPRSPRAGLDSGNTSSEIANKRQQKGPASPITHADSHFTPYESPLKQFRSYRNHPEYLNEVPHGFRSLTYSHAINPELPICRYELDGVCNDASCQSQHFKSLGLSDERILVDLGTTPKESDVTAYTDGLKLLVQDIRSRRVKDVNKVASEITAYRRKFLGEDRIISM